MKKKGVLAVIRVTVLAMATGGWLGCASAKTAKDLQYNHEFYEIILDESFFIEEPYDYLTEFYTDGQKALEIEVNEACGYCGSTSSILTNLFGMHGEAVDIEEDTIENAFGTYTRIKADIAYEPSAAEQIKGIAEQPNELHYIFTDNKMFTLDVCVNTEILSDKEIKALIDSVVLTETVADLQLYEKGKYVSVTKEDVERMEAHFKGLGYDNPKEEAIEYARERMALFAAAAQNGYSVTEEEIYAYLNELRTMLEMEENKGQYEAVLANFESEEAYWEYEYKVYSIDLPVQRYVKTLEKNFMNSSKAQKAEDPDKLWDEEFEQIKEDLVEQQGFVAVE